MSDNDRRAANDLQLQIYFQRYHHFWRLHKLINYRHFLKNREEMRVVYRDAYGAGNFDEDQLIYGHITNGVLSDAISELTMLCEDYFGLLRFIRESHLFIKKALAYAAGTVTAKSRMLGELSRDDARRLFFIPTEELISAVFAIDPATRDEKVSALTAKVDHLRVLHRTATTFFEQHKDFHVQYKHGLKLCINGLHLSLPDAEVARRKQELSAPLFAFESKPLFSQGYRSAPFIPAFADPRIGPHAATLLQDLNLLHIEFLDNVDIDDLVSKAKHIVILMDILIRNRLALIEHAGTRRVNVCLPVANADILQRELHIFDVPEGHHVPQLSDYQFAP
jgi:hypothetical protein